MIGSPWCLGRQVRNSRHTSLPSEFNMLSLLSAPDSTRHSLFWVGWRWWCSDRLFIHEQDSIISDSILSWMKLWMDWFSQVRESILRTYSASVHSAASAVLPPIHWFHHANNKQAHINKQHRHTRKRKAGLYLLLLFVLCLWLLCFSSNTVQVVARLLHSPKLLVAQHKI